MHPRGGAHAWTAARRRKARGAAGVRARARRGASARGRRALLARHGRPTTGAARRARRRICWTRCTTAACCAWRGARAASASTRRTSTRRAARRGRTPRARSTRWSTSSSRKYAPLPAPSLATLVQPAALRRAAVARRAASARSQRAKQRLAHARVDGVDWYWPADEQPGVRPPQPDDAVRLLAPFDPVVWDRRRFELLLGLGLPLRGLHAGAQAAARLLRAAAAVARRSDRLGQRRRSTDGALQPPSAMSRGRAPAERRVPCARSTRSSSACAAFSGCREAARCRAVAAGIDSRAAARRRGADRVGAGRARRSRTGVQPVRRWLRLDQPRGAPWIAEPRVSRAGVARRRIAGAGVAAAGAGTGA